MRELENVFLLLHLLIFRIAKDVADLYLFIFMPLPFALGFYMAYAVYIHCLNNLYKIDVFIYLIYILLEQAWKTACSVQFSLAQSLQRCSKLDYQNPGVCVPPPPPPPPPQAAVAPHPKTVTGFLNHLQPYRRWIIGAAVSWVSIMKTDRICTLAVKRGTVCYCLKI